MSARAAAGVVVFLATLAAVLAVALYDPTGERGNRLGKDFAYETKGLRPIARAQFGYAERAQFATGMTTVRGVAVGQEDRILVAGDRVIGVFSAQGAPERVAAVEGEPTCLVATPQGAWYVGMGDHVEAFDAAGARTRAWPPFGPKSIVTSIVLVPEGVAVADAGERIVRICALDGKVLRTIGGRDPAREIVGFIVPSPFLDVVMGADNMLCVTNPGRHKVEAYEPDGTLCRAWGEPRASIEGFCGCCNPVHLAVLPDGGIVTAEKGLVTVKVCEPDGALRCVVAGPEQLGEYALGFDLAVDSKGRIIVLDPAAKKVRVFERRAPATSAPTTTGTRNG
jgi:hypothetical protein